MEHTKNQRYHERQTKCGAIAHILFFEVESTMEGDPHYLLS